jgi:hypothetical protein
MVVMLLICAVLAIGVPIYRSVLEQERQWMCQNNLKMIGVALHTYHDTWQCLPAASRTDASGNPSLSWRVAILPMLEGAPLYDHYTMAEPWNGPNNSKLHGECHWLWRCPEDTTSAPGMTNYVAITGPGTAWPAPNKHLRFSDFKDGTSNTLMVVEIRNSDIHWMEPRDLDIRTLKFAINSDGKNSISSRHFGGAFVLYADGAVRFLSERETEARLREMILIADEWSEKHPQSE